MTPLQKQRRTGFCEKIIYICDESCFQLCANHRKLPPREIVTVQIFKFTQIVASRVISQRGTIPPCKIDNTLNR